jgi:hypothetical protein
MGLLEVPITVSIAPKRKFFYFRHSPIFELEEEHLESAINQYINVNKKLANGTILLVPVVHPYDFCSEAFSSKVSSFLRIMKKLNAASVLFSDLVQLENSPARTDYTL